MVDSGTSLSMESEIRQTLKNYIESELLRGRLSGLSPEDDLFSAGIVNSLTVLELALFVEEQFEFMVPEEDVGYDYFHSINALTAYVAARIGQA